MTDNRIQLRHGGENDLESINAIISACVMQWNLSARIKRLALPSYHYQRHDLGHLSLELAEDDAGQVVGVAAWEAASAPDLPKAKRGLLLHGLYVDPTWQGRGVGSRLIRKLAESVRAHGLDGLLVKSQADARGFFQAQGFQELPVENMQKDYTHRYWLPAHEV